MTSTDDAFEQTEDLLSLDDPDKTLAILRSLDICDDGESIQRIEKAGEGNMNLVLRVTTNRQSLIVKQARPWVEKYPSIAAPVDRIVAETEFYQYVAKSQELATQMPKVIASDVPRKLLVLQDLGSASDFLSLYDSSNTAEDRDDVFQQATIWLANLHRENATSESNVGCFQLRELNHAHMFSIPLMEPPAIELDTVCRGLKQASESFRSNESLKNTMEQLGEIYLRPDDSNRVLLHGDYYPGSWLSTKHGFRVIDPEFCFSGPPEFDLGVLLAHYLFCHATANTSSLEFITANYQRINRAPLSTSLLLAFAGAELVRRLIGVAQLPLDADLEQRKCWLDVGKSYMENMPF